MSEEAEVTVVINRAREFIEEIKKIEEETGLDIPVQVNISFRVE